MVFSTQNLMNSSTVVVYCSVSAWSKSSYLVSMKQSCSADSVSSDQVLLFLMQFFFNIYIYMGGTDLLLPLCVIMT